MSYREFAPPAELSAAVACTWERKVPTLDPPAASRVLPDGCVDLVWRADRLLVAGPDRGAFLSPLVPGTTVVGLRLRPGAAGPLLGLPAAELRDTRAEADALWGRGGEELRERIGDQPGPGARRIAMTRWVRRRIRDASPDPLIAEAARRLGRPGSRVGALADELAISERQLRRRFDEAVGYGPKTLDRVLRFQRFVAAARTGGEEGLARVAAELGYADQAHLTRECVQLSGLTPTALAAAAP